MPNDTAPASAAQCCCALCTGNADAAAAPSNATAGVDTIDGTGSAAAGGDIRITSLLSERYWPTDQDGGLTLTYGFPDSTSDYRREYSDRDEPTSGFQALSQDEQAAVRRGLELWSEAADITFLEVDERNGIEGALRFARTEASPTAHAYYPGQGSRAGDVWFGRAVDGDDGFEPNSYDWHALLHEIGHALGLKHPHDPRDTGVTAPSKLDWIGTSVMSYASYPGDSTAGYGNDTFTKSLMIHDILAVQALYGEPRDPDVSDTVYTYTRGARAFETILDFGGVDTIDASDLTAGTSIDLRAGHWSDIGRDYSWRGGSQPENVVIFEESAIENALGGQGSDKLMGNRLDNLLEGQGGRDKLRALDGDDTLDGGEGRDVIKAGRGDDRILASAGKDKIDGNAGDDVWVLNGEQEILSVKIGKKKVKVKFEDEEGDRGKAVLKHVEYLELDGVLYDLASVGRAKLKGAEAFARAADAVDELLIAPDPIV